MSVSVREAERQRDREVRKDTETQRMRQRQRRSMRKDTLVGAPARLELPVAAAQDPLKHSWSCSATSVRRRSTASKTCCLMPVLASASYTCTPHFRQYARETERTRETEWMRQRED